MLMLFFIKKSDCASDIFRHPTSVGCFFFIKSANYSNVPHTYYGGARMNADEIIRAIKIAGWTIILGSFGIVFFLMTFSIGQ